MAAQGRLLHSRWDQYDTRQVVYQPARLSAAALEAGYWGAYRDFYRWGNIARGAFTKLGWTERLRHMAYAGGWKKFEPLWDWVIRAKQVTRLLPLLEKILSEFGKREGGEEEAGSRQSEVGRVSLPVLPSSVVSRESRPSG